MNKNEAIDEAIDALDNEANGSYEGEELEDPSIKAWQQKKYDAADILRSLKDGPASQTSDDLID